MKITYTGKFDDIQGVIRCASGFKPYFSRPYLNGLTTSQMDDMPKYKTFKCSDVINVTNKTGDPDFWGWGPYNIYSMIPYYVVYGEGLPPNASFLVKY